MEKARDIFAEHNLRCTKQRMDVYNTLAACRCHPTAEQLHRLMMEHCPGASLATVYNTLEVLCQAGLCRRINTPCGSRYDADVKEHLHIQLSDGRVLDAPEGLGQEILAAVPADAIRQLESRLGVDVRYLSIQLFADSRDDIETA